jgi:hypothetical protein
MNPDWVARGLALGSLALSATGAAVAFLAYRRDRPRLLLVIDYGRLDTSFALVVVNNGYRAVSVARVELATVPISSLRARLILMCVSGRFGRFGKWWITRELDPGPTEDTFMVAGRNELDDPRLPVLLAPGESARFFFRGDPFPNSRRLYAVVKDVLGREVVRGLSEDERNGLRMSRPPVEISAKPENEDAP